MNYLYIFKLKILFTYFTDYLRFNTHTFSIKILSILNKYISFLISTSLFLAISGSMKVLVSCLLLNVYVLDAVVLTFFITYGIYGLNKLTDIKEDAINNPERAVTIKKFEIVFKYSVAMAFIFSILLSISVNILALPVLLFPLFTGILYSVRISKNLPRLKDITGVKNLSIALSWSVVTAFLPVVSFTEKKIFKLY